MKNYFRIRYLLFFVFKLDTNLQFGNFLFVIEYDTATACLEEE